MVNATSLPNRVVKAAAPIARDGLAVQASPTASQPASPRATLSIPTPASVPELLATVRACVTLENTVVSLIKSTRDCLTQVTAASFDVTRCNGGEMADPSIAKSLCRLQECLRQTANQFGMDLQSVCDTIDELHGNLVGATTAPGMPHTHVHVWHSGQQAILPDGRADARQAYYRRQRMAAYIGGKVPHQDMFQTVQCLDIAQNGMSFLSLDPPRSDMVVVTVGDEPREVFLSARVANICTAGVGEGFRVGVEFVGRLHRSLFS